MTIQQHLNQFYQENNIPVNGGADDTVFSLKFGKLSLTLPNPKFRQRVLHIHDIQHVLYNCDTSWKGESFISGWEIATGMWKHFPIGLFSLSAMGYGLWTKPTFVFEGFEKGLNCIGVIDLKLSKENLLALELPDLVQKTTRKTSKRVNLWPLFLFWSIISQLFFLFPFLIVKFGLIWSIQFFN